MQECALRDKTARRLVCKEQIHAYGQFPRRDSSATRDERVVLKYYWNGTTDPVVQSRDLMRRIKSVTGLSVHRHHVLSLISASVSIDAIYRRERIDSRENEPGTRWETGRPRVNTREWTEETETRDERGRAEGKAQFTGAGFMAKVNKAGGGNTARMQKFSCSRVRG